MTLSFDPTRAYGHSWKYFPGVVEGRMHYRTAGGVTSAPYIETHGLRLDVSKNDWVAAALAVELTANTTFWHLWPDDEDPALPGIDDLWQVLPNQEDAGDWIIRAITKGRWGAPWLVGTVYASTNG